MAIATTKVRTTLVLVFLGFLLLNVVFLTMAILAAVRGDVSLLPWHLGEDMAFGVRAGILLVGCFASWMLARTLYQTLVKEDVDPGDAVGPSWSLASYLALVVAVYTMLGIGTWLWLPLLFLIVTVWAILTVWSMVGASGVVAAVAVAIVAAALTAYVMA